MVLLEQYVTLYEKRWKSVFAGWKIFQITIYFITGIAGILSSFCLGKLVVSFEGYCLLYSNVTLLSGGQSRQTDVDMSVSDWGKETYCAYCQYVPVCSVIFASMWATFFTMCGRGGRSDHGLPQPWRIVYPAMIFNSIYFIIALIALVWYEGGYYQFCQSLIRNNNNIKDCNELRHYDLKDTSGKDAMMYLFLTRIGLWGVTFGWLLGALLLVLRCCFMADFTVMKITVIGATPMEEEAPKASPESVHLSPEEKSKGSLLDVPGIL